MTTAVDVYVAGGGMCRDFAHLSITFCRALNIPARYVFGYMPDIGVEGPFPPMDFHAWFEVYLGDRWWTFDARFNTPRIGRIPIGIGRDAVDVAMVTTYGPATFQRMVVWTNEEEERNPRESLAVAGRIPSEGLVLGRGEDEQ
jgi:transglutaminase-like putative cysteine protease